MLDTNVWSMIGRAAAGSKLYRLLAAIDGQIVVPPSTLLELARGADLHRIPGRHRSHPRRTPNSTGD